MDVRNRVVAPSLLAILSTCVAAAPLVDLSRTTVDGLYSHFGDSANPQSVVLTNIGSDPLLIGAVALTGTGAASFSLAGPCANGNVTLAPGQECLFEIHFAPSSAQTNATLSISSNAAGSPHAVALFGHIVETGVGAPYAYATFNPPYVDYGSLATGATSLAHVIALTSAGNTRALTITSITLGGRHPGDFSYTTTCQPGTSMPIGSACSISAQFSPTTAGPRSAEIYVKEATLTTPFPIALNGGGGGVPPAATPDLNQHGLTGSWYEAATSGQGLEVEVFPNLSPGAGLAQVSWFTYDTVIGGAERQRWYTAQGAVVTGQSSASLTIYQNTGGNFNAPPVTAAQPVGTATLSFDTCTSGQLSYSFTDGTGRTGAIPLTRLTQNMTCSTTIARPTNADFALSGNWYDPATSGQGFTVEVNANSSTAFAAWYTYAPNGASAGAGGQRWYTAQGTFTPGMRSIPVSINETTGGMFDTPTPPGQRTVPVGGGTLAFQSCSAATFSYSLTGGSSNGQSGTIPLSRVGPVPPGCMS